MLSFSLKNFTVFVTLLLVAYIPVIASESPQDSSKKETYNPVPAIMHHISDSHEWHFWGEGENSVTIHLPVILWSEDGLIGPFLSSNFHHNDDGHHVVDVNGHKLVRVHGKIYKLNDGQLNATFDDQHHVLNATIPLDFSITKNVASMLFALVLLLMFFGISGSKAKKNKSAPSGLLSFLEPLVLFVRDDIVKPNIGKNYQKYLPYLLTLFFFILMNNLVGLLPGSANVTGNIAITLVLFIFGRSNTC